MSRLSTMVKLSSGTVGWASQCFEPSIPSSSESQEANSNDRFSAGASRMAWASSSTPAVPLALSSAPG